MQAGFFGGCYSSAINPVDLHSYIAWSATDNNSLRLLVHIHRGRAKVNADGWQVTDFIHDAGHMQQRLAGDAADVQTNATELGVALHQNHFETQISRAPKGSPLAPRLLQLM